ncbi:MAG: lectin like domain-containing protein, partial [Pirellulaceae bacterium]|nr:lectin like domain-containing protein [Pirellulaceae bacterium]
FKNSDLPGDPKGTGMKIHAGGDYRVSAAYMSRGDGFVLSDKANSDNVADKNWFQSAPEINDEGYQKFYARDIEWYVLGPGLEGISAIKRAIMRDGAIGTCYCSGRTFLSKDFIHYQPHSSPRDPNHSVAIIGWDDTKITSEEGKRPPLPGAWLIKNSWGTNRGDNGYYWISYFDKHAAQHVELGAASFRNIEPLRYNSFYYHDYHGWRDSLTEVSRAFNAYTAEKDEEIVAASFYTSTNNVDYTVKIFGRFEDGLLLDELGSLSGTSEISGFHTVDLAEAVNIKKDDKFYVYVEFSNGGHAIDRTSYIPVLLGADEDKPKGPIVTSKASPGESYYYDGSSWKDLYDYKFDNPSWGTFDKTANFCIKALGK